MVLVNENCTVVLFHSQPLAAAAVQLARVGRLSGRCDDVKLFPPPATMLCSRSLLTKLVAD